MYREDNLDIKVFCSFIQQPECEAWLKGKQIVQKILRDSATLSDTFSRQVLKNVQKIKSLLMLIYVYSLNLEPNYLFQDYKNLFITIRGIKGNHAQYNKVMNWISAQKSDIKQTTLQLLLEHYTAFLYKKLTFASPVYFGFCIHIFSKFQITRQRDMTTIINFMSYLQQVKMVSGDQYCTKETKVLRNICQILSDQSEDQGNMGILFDETIIGSLSEKNIQKFCSFYDDYICQLTAEQLLRIISGICLSSLNSFNANLILRISLTLKNQDQFFKLKYLYEKYILVHLIRKGKYCSREKAQDYILVIAQFYVIGFLTYCDIGKIGIECLLENVQNISNLNTRKRWIQLAFFVSNKQRLSEYVYRILQAKKISPELIKQCQSENEHWNEKQSWQITVRNIRQHKVYKYQRSALKGIKNEGNQCYVISTVQSLLRNKGLFELFNEIGKIKRHTAVFQLCRLFELLSREKTDKDEDILIDSLIYYGPKLFASSKSQEDVHQYLLGLMDQLESQLKEEKKQFLKKFKQIYQIQERGKVKCHDCTYERVNIQKTYIHTVANSEKIRLEWDEKLTDFSCERCFKKNVTKSSRIYLNCQIFIIHINRFSILNKEAKKELPTQKIPRKIQNFQLAGVIFHIGKHVESGHYVYLWKKGAKRWVEFNDTRVFEFDIQNENEEFEREFKAEKTPYILFYRKFK